MKYLTLLSLVMLVLCGSLTTASAQSNSTGDILSYDKDLMQFLVVDRTTLVVKDTISVNDAMHCFDEFPANEKAVKRNELIEEMRKPE